MKRLLPIALSLVACSTEPAGEAPSARASVEVEASPATRAETGVVVWSMPASPDGGLSGLDANGHLVVEISHQAKVQDGRQLDALVLQDERGSSRVVYATQPNGTIELLDAVVPDRYRRIAHLIATDLSHRVGTSDSSSLATSSLGPRSIGALEPLDLVNEACLQLIVDCDTAITTVNAARAEAHELCLGNDAYRASCEPSSDPESCVASWQAACANALEKNNAWAQKKNDCTAKDGSTKAEYDECKQRFAEP